jgi:uncharacterized protein YeaO (DUF488 family)/iron-sulfur cluster repair protein YtfE (RIC family)
MAMTAAQACETMRAHHRALREQLAARAGAVSGAVASGGPYEAAVGRFIAYLAGMVLPHAAAEEKTIYPLAEGHAELAAMIGEMTAEHITLSAAGSRLAVLTDGRAAAGQAMQIAELFATHATKENDVLFPVLLKHGSPDLASALGRLHGSTEYMEQHEEERLAPDGTAGSRVRVRRVYDPPSPGDGARVLVDRVWPRGLRKNDERFGEWAKDVAPSAQLRVWYRHEPARFDEFRRRYRAELTGEPAKLEAVARLRAKAAEGPVTLLTATRELNLSQAAVLAEFLARP